MPLWLHVLACLTVPALWGALMVRLFSAVDSKRSRGDDQPPPIDYSI